jgi:hypothetical protein
MTNYFKKDIIIHILQIVTLHNAVMLGWTIKKINNNTFELTKSIDNINYDLKDLIEQILKNNLIDI